MIAMSFKSFEEAMVALPPFIVIDPLIHTTVDDLAFVVRHEIDLYVEGESNDIQCVRRTDTTKRYGRCRRFLLRCQETITEVNP